MICRLVPTNTKEVTKAKAKEKDITNHNPLEKGKGSKAKANLPTKEEKGMTVNGADHVRIPSKTPEAHVHEVGVLRSQECTLSPL